jgi:hypothetical protein
MWFVAIMDGCPALARRSVNTQESKSDSDKDQSGADGFQDHAKPRKKNGAFARRVTGREAAGDAARKQTRDGEMKWTG